MSSLCTATQDQNISMPSIPCRWPSSGAAKTQRRSTLWISTVSRPAAFRTSRPFSEWSKQWISRSRWVEVFGTLMKSKGFCRWACTASLSEQPRSTDRASLSDSSKTSAHAESRLPLKGGMEEFAPKAERRNSTSPPSLLQKK